MIKFLMLLTIFTAGLLTAADIASDDEGEELKEIKTTKSVVTAQVVTKNDETTPELLAPPPADNRDKLPRPKTPAYGSKRKE